MVILSLFCLQAQAQTFEIKGGLTLANVSANMGDLASIDYKWNAGFHIGTFIDVPFNDLLSLEPGLLFSTKGMRYDEELEGVKMKAVTNMYYLNIPVALKITENLGFGFKVYGLAGPYLGFGLFGKNTYEALGVKTKEDIKWGSGENDDFRTIDYGLTFGGGLEVNSIQFEISYDLGLANIAADQSNDLSIKNKVLRFTIGYRFGK